MRPLLEQESVYFFYSCSRFVDNFYTIVQKLSFGRIYSSGQALVQALDAEGRAVVRIGASSRPPWRQVLCICAVKRRCGLGSL